MMPIFLRTILVFSLILAGMSSCSSTSSSGGSEDDSLLLESSGDDFTGSDSAGDETAGDDDFGEEEGFDEPAEQSAESEEIAQDDFEEEDFASQGLEPFEAEGEMQEEQNPQEMGMAEEGFGKEDSFGDETPPAEEMSSQPVPMEPDPSFAAESPPAEVYNESIEISDIKFLANRAGGTVVVETNGPASYQTRVNESTNQFVLEIANVKLPERLKRPYIMKDFDGEFAAINAYQSPGSSTARVVVQMRNPGNALVQQEGNSFLILPPTADNLATAVDDAEAGEIFDSEAAAGAEGASSEEASYDVEKAEKDEKLLGAKNLDQFFTGDNRFYGKRLSIQTKDADVRDALNFIAEYSGVNMIISDDVKGTISLKLREVPWDQALVTIMKANQLGYIRQGNVIRISTLETLKNESNSAKAIVESQKALIPMRVRVIPVSYATVDNLTKQLTPFLTEGRGKLGYDNRTSSLIVTDTDEVINRVARLVKSLDVPPMQVMIEGKIIEATEEFQRSVGVNWNFDGERVNLSSSGGANGGPLDLRTNLSINPISAENLSGNPFALNLTVGRLDFLGELGAILALAETETMVKILSSPRIVTINKETAQITQEGQVLTRSTVTDNSGNKKSSIERTPVTLNLIVTPQITAVGSVILDVQVKRQFASGQVDAESLARSVNTREAKTKVLVDNGQTAVIGGVYQNDASQGETGVPLLKDIPILGWLFKYRQRDYQKNELLIFLTPRVINFGELNKEGDIETSSTVKWNEIAS